MTRTAIIGAGAIAYCHAEALRRLGVDIAGVLDINRASAEKLAARYGAVVLDDLEKAVESLDMVHICTPPSLRIDYARTAMAAGCHVLMEKPMAISVADGQSLVDMADRYGVRLMVDFNHRFRAGFQQLSDVVERGAIGNVVNVHIQRMGMLGGNAGTRNDTWRTRPETVCGMSIESLSHDIDMIVQLAGPIVGVQADVRRTLADVPQFDTDANVLLTLKNGAMGLICASWSSHLKGSTRGVVGSKGSVVLEGDDLFDFARLRLRTHGQPHEQVTRLDDHYEFATCPSYFNVNSHFLECVKQGKESSASGRRALETLEVSHAILEAAQTHTVVTV